MPNIYISSDTRVSENKQPERGMWEFCFPKSKSRREAGECSVYIYVSCPPISKIKVNQRSQLRAATHHTHTVTQMFSNISGGLKVLSSFSMTDFSVCVREGEGKSE